WRNKAAPNPDGELGWELNGKFYTQEQATQLGIQDPDLQVKFRQARRRDGKIRIRVATPSLPKIPPACQGNSPQAQIADSSSTNAVSFSSARTTKRFRPRD